MLMPSYNTKLSQIFSYTPDLPVLFCRRYWYSTKSNSTICDLSPFKTIAKYTGSYILTEGNADEMLAFVEINNSSRIILYTKTTADFIESVPNYWTYRILSAVEDSF